MGKNFKIKKNKFKPRKLKKYVMTIDKPKRIVYWTAIETGLDIMMHLQPQNRLLIVHYDEEMRWIPEMCICAPVYAKLRPKGDWYPCELEKIKKAALSLHEKTKLIFKLVRVKGEDIKIQPSCVYPSFFVEGYRARILIGNENKMMNNIAGPENYSKIQKIIASNDGMVLVNGDKFLSFWPVGSSRIYAYSPAQGEHIDLSFMIRSNDFKKLLDYLVKNLKLCGPYSTYTLKILRKEVIPTDLDEVMEKHEILTVSPGPFRDFPQPEPDWPKPKPKPEPKEDDEAEAAPKTEEGPELRFFEIKFSKDYNNDLFPDRGFLYAGFYLRDPKRIVHINVAAAIFLHHFHGIFWENRTISDVFELGNRIYQEAELAEKLNHPDWTKRFALPIRFCNREYRIAFEKVVYGDITTQDQIVANIRLGVTAFFKQHDMGMIWGPHVQLIWQESNMYFTFSPKERDAYGRKWTNMMSYDLPKVSEKKRQGSAGVSWFKRPELIADTYYSNVRLKHRKDAYKILKLRIFEAKPFYESWYNWSGFGPNKWSLIGERNICEYIDSSAYQTQYPKIFSIAVIAAMFCIVRDTTEWDKSTIDELMGLGVQYYNECIQRRPILESSWTLEDLIKEYRFCNRIFVLYFISENIKGFVFKQRGPFPNLIQAFKSFFENYAYGVLVVRDITIPFFWDSGHFTFLFLYDRVFGKTQECLCNFDNIYSPYRSHAFGMSFKTITEMYSELVILLSMEDNDKFLIHSIEPIERPPLMHYCPFGEFGAKLDAYDDYHEGDEKFDFRADKQTYCNLILGLCYAWFSRPLEWDQEDVNDLLFLGDKMYCRIVAELTKCTEKNFELKLSDCKPVVIGINGFTFTESKDNGIFKYIPEATEEGEECEDEDMNLTGGEDDEGEGAMGYATVYTRDIYKMLEHWDQPSVESAFVILDSKLMQMAIWKKNGCFFIYDPKAARLDGKLTERRMAKFHARLLEHANETDFKHYKNCGVAYVAYFYTWEAFLDYIIYLVPEENYTEPCTINTIEITGQPLTVAIPDPKKADKVTFVPINANTAVLRASMSQDEAIFTYRNQQEAAMCIAALAFARLTPAWKWNKQIMDVILRYGDRLYQQSMLTMEDKNPARLCSGEKLTVPEICPTFTIYKIKFQFKIDNIVKTALTPGCDNRELKKLYMQMQTIDNEKGVICVIKGYTNAIFRIGPMYFCFDPHKTDPEGYISNDGLANTSRHNNMDIYIKYFCAKSLCIPGPNTYECYSVTIIRIIPPSLPEIFFDNYNLALTKPEHQDVYHDIGDDMRLMKVQFEKPRIPQCFMALGAVLNSRLEYADVWGYHVFKKIQVLGEYIMRQLMCHRTRCVPDQQPILEECNFSIRIDNRLVNFVVSRVIEAVIDPEFQSHNLNLRNGLYAFFKELSKACIIGNSDDKWYALWQDGPRFYMFWLRPEIKKGFVQSAKDWMQLYAIIVAEAKSYHQIYHVKQITTTIIELGDKPKLEVARLCDCFLGDYPDKVICPKCNYDLFALQVRERIRYFNMCKKCFKRFAQGIDIMEPCNLVIKQRFYGSDNYFTYIEACCLVAAGMFTIKGIHLWSKDTIFNIFTSGADLLATSVAVSRKTNLHITEMEQQFILCGIPLQIIALTPTKEKIEYDNLFTVLSYILRKHKIAYLMDPCKLCVTLLNDGHAYYLFYPGQNSPDPWCTESSCFIRYDSVQRMVKNLLENSKLTAQTVDIGPIICIEKKLDPLNYQYCKLPCVKVKPCDQVRTKVVKCKERKPFLLK